jgi:hypothetical protein
MDLGASIWLSSVNHAELRARWLRNDQETFLVGSITDLLRAPAPPSSHVAA